jgi:hypothetical protein
MGEIWIPEAEDLKAAGSSNTMSGIGGPRATLHCTVSNPGSFDAMHRVLISKTSEPHLLYDPKTDRLGQYFPLNKSARALARGTLAYSHNKVGSVNIQIEVCAMPVDWTANDANWNPGKNFKAMMRAIRSWGIKDEFIYRPAKSAADRSNVVRPNALLTSNTGGSKWWGHCHYGQGETHWDPGPINLQRFFGAAPVPSKPEVPPVAVINPVYRSAEVKALFESDCFPHFDPPADGSNPFINGANWYKYIGAKVDGTSEKVVVLEKKLDQILTLLQAK